MCSTFTQRLAAPPPSSSSSSNSGGQWNIQGKPSNKRARGVSRVLAEMSSGSVAKERTTTYTVVALDDEATPTEDDDTAPHRTASSTLGEGNGAVGGGASRHLATSRPGRDVSPVMSVPLQERAGMEVDRETDHDPSTKTT